MRVLFTRQARRSLGEIYERMYPYSPAAARRTRSNILRRARQIAEHPESGRVVPEFGTRAVRELIEGPYRIWYRLWDDRIEVLAVFHGSRDVGGQPESQAG